MVRSTHTSLYWKIICAVLRGVFDAHVIIDAEAQVAFQDVMQVMDCADGIENTAKYRLRGNKMLLRLLLCCLLCAQLFSSQVADDQIFIQRLQEHQLARFVDAVMATA